MNIQSFYKKILSFTKKSPNCHKKNYREMIFPNKKRDKNKVPTMTTNDFYNWIIKNQKG